MEELNLMEQIEIAKKLLNQGIPISKLKDLGIDISNFPPKIQAELHRIKAIKNMRKTIDKVLDDER